jgi:hypothetical protein
MQGFKVVRLEGGRFWSAIIRKGQTLNGTPLLLEYTLGQLLEAPAGTPGIALFDCLPAAKAFLPSVVGAAAILWGWVAKFSEKEAAERGKLLGPTYQTELTEEGLLKVTAAPVIQPGKVFTAPGTVFAASFLPLVVVDPGVEEFSPLSRLEEV